MCIEMGEFGRLALTVLVLSSLLSGCSGSADDVRVTADDSEPYAGIAANETVRFAGNEPFWSGEISGETLRYSTPENIEGQRISVKRFAGMNGLGFSGTLGGAPFDMVVTPGACADSMADRIYPFTVTLRLGDDVRNGCGWTDAEPFSGSQNP